MKTAFISALGLVLAATAAPASAQDGAMQWQFAQNNSNSGNSSATLSLGVPETDNTQLYASCGVGVPSGQSEILIGTNFGDLQPGSSARIRFSGNGREYEFEGTIAVPASGEGIAGIRMFVGNDDPLWQAFDSNAQMSYQIPGYTPSLFNLVGGQNAIRNFVEACRFLSGKTTQTAGNSGNTSGNGLTEKEAFDLAKDLNSPEAWQAFLKVYPTGFFAELARGYLARLGDGGNTTTANTGGNTPSPPKPQFQYLDQGPGSAPWFNEFYEQDEGNATSYAATVRGNGIELTTWCSPNRQMNLILAETAGNSYPQLDQRLEQAQNAGQAMQVRASGGSSFQLPFTQYGLTGEIAVGDQFSPSNLLITSLMKDNSVTFSTGSFGATLQLRGSRKAICNVINRCGAVVQGCQPKPKKVVKPRVPNTNSGRCRARSVWVPGRGCILRKYINQGPAKGCRAGQVRFAGQCMYPSEKRGFCGPGYTPRGNRCVHNADLPRRQRLQQGVFVTQAYCRRLGLTKEGNYCVEDD